nr:chitinase [uncultured bacterium]
MIGTVMIPAAATAQTASKVAPQPRPRETTVAQSQVRVPPQPELRESTVTLAQIVACQQATNAMIQNATGEVVWREERFGDTSASLPRTPPQRVIFFAFDGEDSINMIVPWKAGTPFPRRWDKPDWKTILAAAVVRDDKVQTVTLPPGKTTPVVAPLAYNPAVHENNPLVAFKPRMLGDEAVRLADLLAAVPRMATPPRVSDVPGARPMLRVDFANAASPGDRIAYLINPSKGCLAEQIEVMRNGRLRSRTRIINGQVPGGIWIPARRERVEYDGSGRPTLRESWYYNSLAVNQGIPAMEISLGTFGIGKRDIRLPKTGARVTTATASGQRIRQARRPDAATTRAANNPAPPRKPIVLGYYPAWDSGLSPDAIAYAKFTHICHAFLTADSSGTLKLDGNLPSDDLTRRAHAAGTKVLLSVGGMDSGAYLGPIAVNPELSARFVSDVTGLMVKHGYDGVDLDWEFPSNMQERDGLTSMAIGFRREFAAKKPGALLTAAASGTKWGCRFTDGKALLPLLDFINVMTYDVHGPWGDRAGHNAPLRQAPPDKPECAANAVEGQMAYWMEKFGWPRERLVVGVPCYGRGFLAAKPGDKTSSKDKAPHQYVPYKDIAKLLADGWVRHWDAGASVPWLTKEGVGEFISYDDPESAAIKGRWAEKSGFGGVFFWEISLDMISGKNAIVDATTGGWRGGESATSAPARLATSPASGR